MEVITNKNFGKNTPEILTLMRSWNPKEICDFHHTLGNKTTPLIQLPHLAKSLGIKNILVKDESSRLGLNSFKPLGASYSMHKEIDNNPNIEVFCTATDGNHGRSVAWMARKLKKRSVIYVPCDTTESRIKSISEEGAKVHVIDGSYDATVEKAKSRCQLENQEFEKDRWSLVQDTAWNNYKKIPLDIMKGYWTQIHEITKQISPNSIDVLFLQAGVGSWAASLISYIMIYWENPPKMISVEPLSANCVHESIRMGHRVSVHSNQKTIMAGLNCGTVSTMAWAILKNYIYKSISIPDSFSKNAIKLFANPIADDQKIISGESGAGGLGGLLALINGSSKDRAEEVLKDSSTVLIINTEGATDPINYNSIIGED